MRKASIFTILAVAAVLAGCAKNESADKGAAAKRQFEAWIQVNHPDAQDKGGIYILEDTPGVGDVPILANEPYLYVNYTVTDLEGNVVSTTDEKVAKRIGTYSKAYYYGERVWWATYGTYGIYAGLENLFADMRVGGKRKAAIPYWLCTTDRYDSEEQYLKKITTGSNLIYEVTLEGICDDIIEQQGKDLDAYSKAYLDGVDSTYIAGKEDLTKFGFYYKTVDPGDKPEYEMPLDTVMYLNYTGKLLNGKVFDTNIANVAKDAGIYSASSSYSPVKITRSENYTDITMGDSSSLISGFQAALFMMHPNEKAITAFYSTLGYGATGTGEIIPPYSPLVFELELVAAP